MTYNLDDMIKDSGLTPEQIAEGVKEMDWEARIYAIKAKRERQDATKAQWARKYDGAKTADEWTRDDFACFIKQAPQLDKLSTPELRALFLKDSEYDPDSDEFLYTRYANLYMWRRQRQRTVPRYELAPGEVLKLTNIWRNLRASARGLRK